MEKQENFCKRQAQKLCRLFPVAILLFLFLSVPLKGYSNEAFSSEGMQQNTVKVTGTVKDTNGEPIIGANVMVVAFATGVPPDIYAFHRYTGNSIYLCTTQAAQF